METKRLRHSLCLFFRSESHGLVTSNAALAGGRRPLPVPASAALRRARGSPRHSCGSGTDLPPVTPEESQGMPSQPRLLLSVFSTLKLQLVELLQMRFWENSWIVFY